MSGIYHDCGAPPTWGAPELLKIVKDSNIWSQRDRFHQTLHCILCRRFLPRTQFFRAANVTYLSRYHYSFSVLKYLKGNCNSLIEIFCYMTVFLILSKCCFVHIPNSERARQRRTDNTDTIRDTREITKWLSGRGNQREIWNVLPLGLHMVFHSANEKLDCFAIPNTASKGNPELQKFSFNELCKLIMFP